MEDENVSVSNVESSAPNMATGLGAGLFPVKSIEDSVTEFTKGLGEHYQPQAPASNMATGLATGIVASGLENTNPPVEESTKAMFERIASKGREATFLPEACKAVESMKSHAKTLGERASLAQGISIPQYMPDYSNPMEKLTNAIAEVSAKLDRLLAAQGL